MATFAALSAVYGQWGGRQSTPAASGQSDLPDNGRQWRLQLLTGLSDGCLDTSPSSSRGLHRRSIPESGPRWGSSRRSSIWAPDVLRRSCRWSGLHGRSHIGCRWWACPRRVPWSRHRRYVRHKPMLRFRDWPRCRNIHRRAWNPKGGIECPLYVVHQGYSSFLHYRRGVACRTVADASVQKLCHSPISDTMSSK